MPAPDLTVARQVARMSQRRDPRPKDVRLVGVAYLLGALMCFLFTAAKFGGPHVFYPALVFMVPALVANGVWFLIDASALASGRRQHQKAIIAVLSIGAVAIGVVASEILSGGLHLWS